MKNKLFLLCVIVTVTFRGIASAQQVEGTKLSGLLHFHYQKDDDKNKNSFFFRRAELTVSGRIKPEIQWLFRVDPAQIREDDIKVENKNITSVGRKSPLQDCIITLNSLKNFTLNFGQYKIPFGMEALESTSKLDFVERSLLSQKGLADRRDIGITFNKSIKNKFTASIGVFNGSGQNRLDTDNTKDVVGRITAKVSETFHLGVAHCNGKGKIYTGGEIKLTAEPFVVYGELAGGNTLIKIN